MSEAGVVFYICTKCFMISEREPEGAEHTMIRCDIRELTPELRKPLFDEHGRLVTRAPRWFLEAVEALRSAGG